MNTLEHRAFILPGEEVAANVPDLLALLRRCQTTWEQFVHLSLNTLLDHVNRGGLEDIEQASIRAQSKDPREQIAHDETMECIITEVLAGIDCVEESSDAPEETYLTVSDGVLGLYSVAVRYLPRVFDTRYASSQGIPSEIRIARMIGYDIVLDVTYLIHR